MPEPCCARKDRLPQRQVERRSLNRIEPGMMHVTDYPDDLVPVGFAAGFPKRGSPADGPCRARTR